MARRRTKEQIAKAKKTAKIMLADKPLKKEFKDKEETFRVQSGPRKGEIVATGNRVMHSVCGFCDYRAQCWPDSQLHKKVGTQATQRPFVWYTKLKKREIVL